MTELEYNFRYISSEEEFTQDIMLILDDYGWCDLENRSYYSFKNNPTWHNFYASLWMPFIESLQKEQITWI